MTWDQIIPILIREELARLARILIDKNKNYGNAIMTSPELCPNMSPMDVIDSRISEKFSRIRTLKGGSPDLVGESLEETFDDICGYIILRCLARRVRNTDGPNLPEMLEVAEQRTKDDQSDAEKIRNLIEKSAQK